MGLFTPADSSLVEVTAAFPPNNPFARVVNGEQNSLQLTVHNGASSDIQLVSASASFHDPENHWKTLRNTTTRKFKDVPILAGSNVTIPYSVFSEFKPRDLGLTVYVDFLDGSRAPFRAIAYNSTVQVVEQPSSFLDPSLLFLYALLAGIFALAVKFALDQYAAATASRNKRKNRRVGAEPQKKVVVPAQGGGRAYPASVQPYEEEWIPEHVLRSRKAAAHKTAAVSGDDSEVGATATTAQGKNKQGKNKGGRK